MFIHVIITSGKNYLPLVTFLSPIKRIKEKNVCHGKGLAWTREFIRMT